MFIINSAFAKVAIKACVCFWFYFQNSALKMSKMKHSVIFPLYLPGEISWDHEWNRTQQIGVLSSHPFKVTEMFHIDDDGGETIFSSMDLLSPSGHSDAQTLAMMLQEQLMRSTRKSGVIQWISDILKGLEDLT